MYEMKEKWYRSLGHPSQSRLEASMMKNFKGFRICSFLEGTTTTLTPYSNG